MTKADPNSRTLRAPTGPILSRYLRALAQEIHTVDKNGDPLSRAAALAELVWKYALGFTKLAEKPDEKDQQIPPATWAIELLYNRIEGKVMTAPPDDQGHSLTDKVTELGRARANSLAKAAAEEDGTDE